jgi:hypothetical protein
LARWYGHALGVTAAGQQCTHWVADGPAGNALAAPRDDAAALETRIRRRSGWRIVVALALHEVSPVHRGCRHVDEHFAYTRSRVRNLLDLEHVGGSGMGDHGGTHAVTLKRAVTSVDGRAAVAE